MKLLAFQKPPPWWLLTTLLLALGCIQLRAQSPQSLKPDFKAALSHIPPDNELAALPSDRQEHLRKTRRLYHQGLEAEQMSTQQLVQLSFDLKANTLRAGKLLKAFKYQLCAVGCLPDYSDCNKSCTDEASKTACVVRCLLQYDICLTQCLLL